MGLRNVNLQLEREAWAGDVDSGILYTDAKVGQIGGGDKGDEELERKEKREGMQRSHKGKISHNVGGPHFVGEEEKSTLTEPGEANRKTSLCSSTIEKQLRMPRNILHGKQSSKRLSPEKWLLEMVTRSSSDTSIFKVKIKK